MSSSTQKFAPTISQLDGEHLCSLLGKVASRLSSANVFITGGTGFFGKCLLDSIRIMNTQLNANIRATVLSRDPSQFLKTHPEWQNCSYLQFVQGDVVDFDIPPSAFTHVIHAATSVATETSPLKTLDTIITGTRRVLNFAVTCGAKQFLLTSSGAVYGTQPPSLELVPESFLQGPNTCSPAFSYHEGKRVAEMLSCTYAQQYGIEVKIARCFAFVGPNLPLDAHFAIGNFIRDASQNSPINILGDGTPLRSYMYTTDLVHWLWTILIDGKTCQPYNVGSNQPISIGALAARVASIVSNLSEHKNAPNVFIAKQPTASTPPARYVPDTSKAETELKLSLSIDLNESIRRTALFKLQTMT